MPVATSSALLLHHGLSAAQAGSAAGAAAAAAQAGSAGVGAAGVGAGSAAPMQHFRLRWVAARETGKAVFGSCRHHMWPIAQ